MTGELSDSQELYGALGWVTRGHIATGLRWSVIRLSSQLTKSRMKTCSGSGEKALAVAELGVKVCGPT